MEIDRAQAADAPRLSQIAWEAKKHWGYPIHWLEAWRDALDIRPEQVAANDYFAACEDGCVIGFYGLHRDGTQWRLEHLWIMPAHWSCGIGRRLFQHAVEHARRHGTQSLAIQSDPHAEGFYLRMGAARIGSVDAAMDGIERVLPILCYSIRGK